MHHTSTIIRITPLEYKGETRVAKEYILPNGLSYAYQNTNMKHSAMLRMNYACGPRYIQELPGHKSNKTTEIYTHVSQTSLQKIKSRFDDLQNTLKERTCQ